MLHLGIDEAGFGPVLGPLAVCAARIEGEPSWEAFAALGVRDSKRLHVSGDLAPLEAVALPGIAWLTGTQPATAAEVFACFDETAAERAAGAPWMADAEHLRLPIAAPSPDAWRLDGIAPRGLRGRLLHPRQLNAAHRAGTNRAAAELLVVQALLAWGGGPDVPVQAVVDRLGGRRFYREAVQTAWPQELVLIEREETSCSSYRCGPSTASFCVGGEEASPLTALASCCAKYARELHMHLLNSWWRRQLPDLAPTAGYPLDARRWLLAVGECRWQSWRDELVRIGRT